MSWNAKFSPLNDTFNYIDLCIQNKQVGAKGFIIKHGVTRLITPLACTVLGTVSFIYNGGSFVIKAPVSLAKYTLFAIIPLKVGGKWTSAGRCLSDVFGFKEELHHAYKFVAFLTCAVVGPIFGVISPSFTLSFFRAIRLVPHKSPIESNHSSSSESKSSPPPAPPMIPPSGNRSKARGNFKPIPKTESKNDASPTQTNSSSSSSAAAASKSPASTPSSPSQMILTAQVLSQVKLKPVSKVEETESKNDASPTQTNSSSSSSSSAGASKSPASTPSSRSQMILTAQVLSQVKLKPVSKVEETESKNPTSPTQTNSSSSSSSAAASKSPASTPSSPSQMILTAQVLSQVKLKTVRKTESKNPTSPKQNNWASIIEAQIKQRPVGNGDESNSSENSHEEEDPNFEKEGPFDPKKLEDSISRTNRSPTFSSFVKQKQLTPEQKAKAEQIQPTRVVDDNQAVQILKERRERIEDDRVLTETSSSSAPIANSFMPQSSSVSYQNGDAELELNLDELQKSKIPLEEEKFTEKLCLFHEKYNLGDSIPPNIAHELIGWDVSSPEATAEKGVLLGLNDKIRYERFVITRYKLADAEYLYHLEYLKKPDEEYLKKLQKGEKPDLFITTMDVIIENDIKKVGEIVDYQIPLEDTNITVFPIRYPILPPYDQKKTIEGFFEEYSNENLDGEISVEKKSASSSSSLQHPLPDSKPSAMKKSSSPVKKKHARFQKEVEISLYPPNDEILTSIKDNVEETVLLNMDYVSKYRADEKKASEARRMLSSKKFDSI